MKQAVLSHFDLPWIPITGLLIFVICFSLYAFWTYRGANRKRYEQAGEIPLQEAKLKEEFELQGDKYVTR